MDHHNKTRAIRDALRAQLTLLAMRTEVWPLLPDHAPIAKAEYEDILGYDPATGV